MHTTTRLATLLLLLAPAASAWAQPRRELTLASLPGDPDFREYVRERGPARLPLLQATASGDVVVRRADGRAFRGWAPPTWVRRGFDGRAWLEVPLRRAFSGFSAAQVRLDDPRAPRLHELAARMYRGGSTALFRMQVDDPGNGCLSWPGTIQVWELLDIQGDQALHRGTLTGGVRTHAWTPVQLGPGVGARLAPNQAVPVRAIRGDHVEVLVPGPDGVPAIGMVCRADVRPAFPVRLEKDWPRVRSRPSDDTELFAHAVRDPTPLHGPDRNVVGLLLAPGSPLRVLRTEGRAAPSRLYPQGGTWLRVAVQGQQGWIEGYVLHAAVQRDLPRAPLAGPRLRGFGDLLEEGR